MALSGSGRTAKTYTPLFSADHDPTLSWLRSVRYYDASRGDPTGHEKKSDLRRFADVVALAVRLYANPQPWGSAVRHHVDCEVLLPTQRGCSTTG